MKGSSRNIELRCACGRQLVTSVDHIAAGGAIRCAVCATSLSGSVPSSVPPARVKPATARDYAEIRARVAMVALCAVSAVFYLYLWHLLGGPR